MYGTIARMRPRVGHEKALMALVEEWEKTRAPKVDGPVAEFVMKPDKTAQEIVMVAVFEDKRTYEANADDPEQDKWYRRMREHLEADPAWEDGEFIYGHVFKAS